jgi:hypothetical protein
MPPNYIKFLESIYILDSNTLYYMVVNRKKFNTFNATIESIGGFRGLSIKFQGKGRYRLRLKREGKRNIIFNNTLFILGRLINLISVSILIRNGSQVIFNNKGAVII